MGHKSYLIFDLLGFWSSRNSIYCDEPETVSWSMADELSLIGTAVEVTTGTQAGLEAQDGHTECQATVYCSSCNKSSVHRSASLISVTRRARLTCTHAPVCWCFSWRSRKAERCSNRYTNRRCCKRGCWEHKNIFGLSVPSIWKFEQGAAAIF